jgi:hypothetical protein
MAQRFRQCADVRHEPYCFGTRPAAPTAPVGCIMRQFEVRCVRCGSLNLKVIGQFDEEAGELKLFLHCPRCNVREALPLK